MAKKKSSRKRVTARGKLVNKNLAKSRKAKVASKAGLRKAQTKARTGAAKTKAKRTARKAVGAKWTEKKGNKVITKVKVKNPETGKPKTVVAKTKIVGSPKAKKAPTAKQLEAREKFKLAAAARRSAKKGPIAEAIKAVTSGHSGTPAQIAARVAAGG